MIAEFAMLTPSGLVVIILRKTIFVNSNIPYNNILYLDIRYAYTIIAIKIMNSVRNIAWTHTLLQWF